MEPIAIIGMSCRFPGPKGKPIQSIESFWELLRSGQDILREIPVERWSIDDYYDPDPNTPGKMYARKGYFTDGVDQFDPTFFNLAPREVASLDPQQRLVLEVSWEAFECANIAPSTLAGSQTGIFVSTFWDDYSAQRLHTSGQESIDRYATLSNLRSMITGRLAHFFDLHGPNIQIDTACSSSLTAIHLACQSLQNHESDLALAGGVFLLLTPEITIGLCRLNALSADGYSKAFDSQADGFGQGEGCGIVLLKRLPDAQADGDSILAVIRGTAVNHDGHSRTVTTPNGLAQRSLMKYALQQAGITANDVQYIETHGTGTPLGDPIEVSAISEVFCQSRTMPLAIGSVKTNIGHLNSAAGMAGLFKVVLAMQHGEIPPTLHVNQLNPRIPWERLAITVPTEMTPWETENGTPRLAGISSFGLSGSNAHMIVEEAPKVPSLRSTDRPERPIHLLPLSAKTVEALQAQVQSYRVYLQEHPDRRWEHICHTAATGREHFAHRLALVASSKDDALQALRAIEQDFSQATYHHYASRRSPKVAFLFTGQGSQYVGMGQELYQTEPTFREVIDRCDAVFQAASGRSLLELLYPESGQPATSNQQLATSNNDLMESHPCGQAANFAIECALAELWRSWGIEPDVVLGHSLGDFAAAYTAGVIGLEDGLRLVTKRGQLMETAVGSMVSVLASEADILPFIADVADVTIGVINGPTSIVLSGGHESITTLTEKLQEASFKTRKLDIPVAAHSPLLNPVLDDFEQAVRNVTLSSPQLTVISSMTGKPVTNELTDPTYWRHHLRNTVRFGDGVATLHEQRVELFVEIGPGATLLGIVGQVAGEHVIDDANQQPTANNQQPVTLPSLRKSQSDWQQMLTSLGALYVHGVEIDWVGFDKGYARQKVVLPTYPFQRQRYWVDVAEDSSSKLDSTAQAISAVTPLMEHLQAGDVQSLAALLADKLSSDEQAALPAILAQLTEVQQRQATLAEIQDWFYTVEWQLQPLRINDLDTLLSVEPIYQHLSETFIGAFTQPDLLRSMKAIAKTETLCIVYILALFEDAGFTVQAGCEWSYEDIIIRLQAVAEQQRSVSRLLQILVDAKILKVIPDGWQVLQSPKIETSHDELQQLIAAYGDVAKPELTLLHRCGDALGDILQGISNPLELLFPMGDKTIANLYANTPSASLMNNIIQESVAHIVSQFPVGRTIRILEIGAGTGSTTASVLPVLPAGRTEYCFTDIGTTFITQAQETFADCPYIAYQKLDIEQQPNTQGFVDHDYDIVIAANVLHATRNLSETMTHVQQLLAPGGMLILLEATKLTSFATLTFGLTGAWDRLTDQRGESPLLNSSQWSDLLHNCGFAATDTFPDITFSDEILGQTVIVAQNLLQTNSVHSESTREKYSLIFADSSDPLSDRLTRELQQQGCHPLTVTFGTEYRQLAEDHFEINPRHGDDYLRLFAMFRRIEHVICLWTSASSSLQDDVLESEIEQSSRMMLGLMQALVEAKCSPRGVWIVTRDTQAVQVSDTVNGIAHSHLWGFGKVVALEHPELNCTLIDLDETVEPNDEATSLMNELLRHQQNEGQRKEIQENQIVYRNNMRYVARLARADFARTPLHKPSSPMTVQSNATYLITGGLGGLGLEIADWLVEQGANHLLLISRRQPTPAVQSRLDALTARGANVRAVQVDISQREQVGTMLRQIPDTYPLRGIFHAAGVVDDGIMIQQSWERLEKVLLPKVWGTWHLHTLTREYPLDFFVLFSSMAALLPEPGLANYAAANTFLDQFAHYRYRQGLPCVSINWGLWDVDKGMTQTFLMDKNRRNIMHSLQAMSPQKALQSLAFALEQNIAQISVMPVDWSKLAQRSTFLSNFWIGKPEPSVSDPMHASTNDALNRSVDWQGQLQGASSSERTRLLQEYLNQQVAQVLGHAPTYAVPLTQHWTELGMDSLMSIDVKNRIARDLSITIPMIELIDASIEKLAMLLTTEWALHKMGTAALSQTEATDRAETVREETSMAEIEFLEIDISDDISLHEAQTRSIEPEMMMEEMTIE